jgi:hypothetical protein
MTVACDDMNSIIQSDLDKGEAIYPGKVGGLEAVSGRGKVMLYWQLNPDIRVSKTVITWENSGTAASIEKAVSVAGAQIDSTEITGLAEGLYIFSAYTVDKDGNRSIAISSAPVNVYGDIYIGSLPARGIAKTEMLVKGDMRITWQDAPENMLYSLVTYMDHRENANGVKTVDTVFNNVTATTLPGLIRLKPFSVKSIFQVGLDTASTTGSYYPSVAEKSILEASGFLELTDEAARQVTKLTFPLGFESWTLQDLYYFPNLRELDLTQGTSELPTLTYVRNFTNTLGDTTARYNETIGGGNWLYFASGYMSDNNRAIIRDLLESGQLTKIKYTANSYPRLDADLAPYPDKVEIKPVTLPDDILIPDNLRLNYLVENNDKGANIDYSADGSNVPPEIAAKFGGTLKNVYKVTVNYKNSTLAFSLPEGIQFGFVPHGYVKFDVYVHTTDTAYTFMRPLDISKYGGYRNVVITRRSKLNAFPEHSPYGTVSAWTALTYNDGELGAWKASNPWNLTSVPQEHIRLITMQLGSDDVTWGLPGGQTLTYYIANLRMSKNP